MDQPYEKYTRGQNRDRDLHELEGLVRGIAIDGRIVPRELAALRAWCARGRDERDRGLFLEAQVRVAAAIEDGVLDDEERADILHLCARIVSPNAFYSVATADMQRLHGVLAGIAADGRVLEQELRSLREWMDSAEALKGTWPYDEIDSLITGVLSDGMIDADEHRFLIAFTSEFLRETCHLVIESPFDEGLVRHGVCAVQPEITFESKLFCVTGSSPAASRRELEGVIAQLGGVAHPRVKSDLDYLIVAAERSLSWAFSCYGRKVEAAMELRRSGSRLAIVHESDFWDAASEHGVKRPN